jgi:cell wall-associated NlpC family hydrolase
MPLTPAEIIDALETLDETLLEWEDTPYQAGVSLKNVGSDCVRFVNVMLAAMLSKSVATLPDNAQDSALHDGKVLIGVEEFFLNEYGLVRTGPATTIRAGMVLGVAMTGYPFHAAIVGGDGKTVWHCGSNGVKRTSFESLNTGQTRIRRIYVPTDIYPEFAAAPIALKAKGINSTTLEAFAPLNGKIGEIQ